MLKNSKVCFISVTLKSWSGRKLLDPTTYQARFFQWLGQIQHIACKLICAGPQGSQTPYNLGRSEVNHKTARIRMQREQIGTKTVVQPRTSVLPCECITVDTHLKSVPSRNHGQTSRQDVIFKHTIVSLQTYGQATCVSHDSTKRAMWISP